jgi:hypothetical protein
MTYKHLEFPKKNSRVFCFVTVAAIFSSVLYFDILIFNMINEDKIKGVRTTVGVRLFYNYKEESSYRLCDNMHCMYIYCTNMYRTILSSLSITIVNDVHCTYAYLHFIPYFRFIVHTRAPFFRFMQGFYLHGTYKIVPFPYWIVFLFIQGPL